MTPIALVPIIAVAVPQKARIEEVRAIHQGVWYAGAFPVSAFGDRTSTMAPNQFPNSRIFPPLHVVRLCHALFVYCQWANDAIVALQIKTAKYLGRPTFNMVNLHVDAFSAEMVTRQGLGQLRQKENDDGETTMEDADR